MIKKLVLAICCIAVSLPWILCTTHGFERKFWGNVWVDWMGVPWTSQNQEDNLLHSVRVATNWVLGMLSFIALMLCLYSGFQMMISGGDSKKYDAWLNRLKNAGIWLAIIAVSRLIVSLIFYVLKWTIQTN